MDEEGWEAELEVEVERTELMEGRRRMVEGLKFELGDS